MAPVTRATLADLMGVEGKAELIGGKVVKYMATGMRPSEVAGNIYVALRAFARQTGCGRAFTDNLGYAVPELPSGRESFSPDTSYSFGPFPADEMDFLEGAPAFAVEVRSKNNYGDAAEDEMAAKREDYFQSGTLVVWDVDPIAEIVRRYRPKAAEPVVFRRGDIADAEPAVPGWTMSVDDVFAAP
jgi:Uma2 family endonuclease